MRNTPPVSPASGAGHVRRNQRSRCRNRRSRSTGIPSYVKGSPLESARKRLSCGLEWDLPEGQHIVDKAGHSHGEVRIADWRHGAERLRDVALVPSGQEDFVPDIALPAEVALNRIDGAPVFIGHHWFNGQPVLESPKLACLDWSAAKDGPLVGYRWAGEDELRNENLVWIG